MKQEADKLRVYDAEGHEVHIPWLHGLGGLTGRAEESGDGARQLLAAMAAPARYAIVEYLLESGDTSGGVTAKDLATVLDTKLPVLMHHLGILTRAGAIERSGHRARQEGRRYYVPAAGIRELLSGAAEISRLRG